VYTLTIYRLAVGVVCLGAGLFCLAPSAFADPVLKPDKTLHFEAIQKVHDAQHEVDHAWEVFHKAALGGTLSSPAIQTDVEQALHESRGLLVKAREAANVGDQSALESILNRIHKLTARAITASQEQKK